YIHSQYFFTINLTSISGNQIIFAGDKLDIIDSEVVIPLVLVIDNLSIKPNNLNITKINTIDKDSIDTVIVIFAALFICMSVCCAICASVKPNDDNMVTN